MKTDFKSLGNAVIHKKCFATFPCFLLPHYRTTPNSHFPKLMSVGVLPDLSWRWFGPVPQLAAKTCSLQAPLPTPKSCCTHALPLYSASPLPSSWLLAVTPSLSPPPPTPTPRRVHWYLFGRARTRLDELHRSGVTVQGSELALGCKIPLEPRGFLLLSGKHAEGFSESGSYVPHKSRKKENRNLSNESVFFVI